VRRDAERLSRAPLTAAALLMTKINLVVPWSCLSGQPASGQRLPAASSARLEILAKSSRDRFGPGLEPSRRILPRKAATPCYVIVRGFIPASSPHPRMIPFIRGIKFERSFTSEPTRPSKKFK